MVVSAKTPHVISPSCQEPHSVPNSILLSKTRKFKSGNFFPNLKTGPFFVRRSNEISVHTTNSSIDILDPDSRLTELCLTGNLKKAIELLDSIKQLRLSIEEEVLIAVLRLCEWKRAADEGSRIYDYISNSTTRLNLKLGNALLSMFVKVGNMLDAWYVFGKMEERDVFSWNVLIGGYGKNGYFDEALDMYHRMLWDGVRPDVYTFPCVLRSCGGVPDWKRGREVHVHVVRFGFESDIDVVNALITMYAKCRDVSSAWALFDRMPNRDRISWNAMIAGYFENGEYLEGLRLFFTMRKLSVEPDLMTMTSVISACELIGNEQLGREIHGYVAKTEFRTEVSVDNSLIQMYSSTGKWEEAQKVFDEIKFKDVLSWTSMISAYESNGLPDKAIETYKTMEAEGVQPDEITIASVLSACASLGLLDLGIKLHEVAECTGVASYLIVSNTLVDMYSKCSCIDKALEVFHQIHHKNVISWTSIILGLRINNRCFDALIFFRKMKSSLNPNSITLVSALSACARIGASMCGKEIHAYALKNGFENDGYMPNAILDMYVRCGRMEPAWNQFNTHKKDVSCWNILLKGFAEQGKGDLAIKLFHRMIDSEVEPDEITFISLLCACSRAGMVDKGLEYFNSMEHNYFITPNLKHYACIVDLLGRAGRLKDAHEFIKTMPMEPDPAIWGALLNACRIHRQVELGELAAKYIFEMDEESVGYYVLLCNLYLDNDKWDKVARLRKIMREKGLSVDPGCSWVEVKGEIHAFLSFETKHPQAKEINGVLEGFYEKMREAGFNAVGRCVDEVEESKAEIFCGHSERLAVAFGLINTVPGAPISVTKNLYMCESCHNTIKFISQVVRREISVRDTEHFHHFKHGTCSCGDERYHRKAFQ